MKKIKISSVIFALLVSSVSNADIIEVISDNTCNTESVTITSITTAPIGPVPAGSNIVGTPLNSTSCLGFVLTPENDWGNNPSPNKGALYDGLLNGEIKEGKKKDGDHDYYVAGDHFLTNVKDSMVDLDGDGVKTDPGWIRLGGSETKTQGSWNFVYDSIGALNLGGFITMSFSDNGTWSLKVDPLAIPAATAALGRPTVFDHLAFVMKGPNSGTGGSWAIYDFNFHDLIENGLNISLGDTAYDFAGTWDADMFVNDDALSHFSIWAHDPPSNVDIHEPSTLAIFVLGMVGLASRRFKKHL